MVNKIFPKKHKQNTHHQKQTSKNSVFQKPQENTQIDFFSWLQSFYCFYYYRLTLKKNWVRFLWRGLKYPWIISHIMILAVTYENYINLNYFRKKNLRSFNFELFFLMVETLMQCFKWCRFLTCIIVYYCSVFYFYKHYDF